MSDFFLLSVYSFSYNSNISIGTHLPASTYLDLVSSKNADFHIVRCSFLLTG